MKKPLVLIACLSIAFCAYAQEFSVPKDYKFVVADDYRLYEQDVLKAIEWLDNTPVIDQQTKRKEVNDFFLKWVIGCPYVTITVGNVTAPLYGDKKNNNLIMFMAGWTKYALINKEYDNKLQGNLAGIDAVINFYEKNKKWTGKNAGVEKYIKMKKKGTLNDYVKKIVEKEKDAEKIKMK